MFNRVKVCKLRYRLKFDSIKISEANSSRNPALNIRKEDEYLFNEAISYKSDPIVLHRYERVSVTTDQYLWKKNTFLPETFWLSPKRRSKNRIRLLLELWNRKRKQKKIQFEEALWLIDTWSQGYFHWFCDVLQRWFMVKDSFPNVPIAIPSNYLEAPYIRITLESLNIPYQVLESDTVYEYKTLHVMPWRLISGNYVDEVIALVSHELREHLISQQDKSRRAIYVSRANAKMRRVLNEEELYPLFDELGIDVIQFESLPWTEQVKQLEGVSLIVGSHGAGLTNMLFMSPGSTVVEFRHPKSVVQNCYFSLASALGFDYYYYVGEPVDPSDPHTSDVVIDPDQIKKVLLKALEVTS